ncbi:putative lipid II flippase FtsW [Stella sp.]|uniref:putative lipid II flippase FtsW n=1 Tax=Stella sp. TaxID=2912054 RepID=UPI0035AE4381
MTTIPRTDTSLFGQWWWTVDRWTVFALAAIIGVGAVMLLAASPPVAERIGLEPLHFVKRQMLLLPVAIGVIFFVSLQPPRVIRRLALAVFSVSVIMLALTFVMGAEIKGARRWISLPGMSIQPSEFVKPTFAVLTAWLLAQGKASARFPGGLVAVTLFAVIVAMLLKQPDLGMAVVVGAVWFVQVFLAGLPIILVLILAGLGVAGLFGAYMLLPHVTSRINRFLDPAAGDSYQIDRSIEAFANGGLFGRGPGEGTIKNWLPDAHADFVFAVAGEELGLIACLFIVLLFAVVVVRSVLRVTSEQSLFVILAAAGLATQLGLQAVVNMASSLHLMPTKGMTLPFISYGGSSMLALALGTGMLLALTRRRFGGIEP